MTTIGFKSIQLLKTQTLGIGSYGSVCKALCDDLLCAAKIIHPTLFDPNTHQQIDRQREHRLPSSRFMKECEFMSVIKHPNIVQYLGTCEDPQTGLPVLLMELMDDSLTHFLESSKEAVPYHIQVNFSHDIAKAISYLHSNGITHRDLSSNNVLLCGNVKAKVTDFGMAKFSPKATRASFTMSPGTDVYMPPEAVKDNPLYTEKIDCFAIGTLIIQILTRHFPEPGERLKAVQIKDPQFPSGTVYVPVSEVERRKKHISQVDPSHPLLVIALRCLKDSDVERPPAQELCRCVAALKEALQYTKSVKRVQKGSVVDEKTEWGIEIKRLHQQIHDKNETIERTRQEHSQQLRELQQIIDSQNKRLQQERDDVIKMATIAGEKECQALRKAIQEKDQLIEEKDRNLVHVTQELETSQQVTAQFQKRIQELEQSTITSVGTGKQTHATAGTSFTLRWRKANKALSKMVRVSNAVVDGDTVYLRAGGTRHIYAYESTGETCNKLPKCPTELCPLAIVDNHLTTIGGSVNGEVTNQLFSLIGKGRSRRWAEVFRSMPTRRSLSVAVCNGQALIVAGGKDQDMRPFTKVEVLDINSQEWSTAASLPKPLLEATATVCQSCVYFIGGISWSGGTKSVYACTLSDLLHSCQSRSVAAERSAQSVSLPIPGARANSSTLWEKLADLPVFESTCVTLHGRLLAIGGSDSTGTPSSYVYAYHPMFNSWKVISKMNVSRRWCFAAVLRSNELVVMGGYTSRGYYSDTDSVEIATVV